MGMGMRKKCIIRRIGRGDDPCMGMVDINKQTPTSHFVYFRGKQGYLPKQFVWILYRHQHSTDGTTWNELMYRHGVSV